MAAAALAAAAPGAARAADVAGSGDHPLLPLRYGGSEIAEYRAQRYEELHLPVAPVAGHSGRAGNPKSFVGLEGRATRISYRLPPGATAAEAFRNYEEALAQAGFTERAFACAGRDCGIFFLSEARWGRVGAPAGEPRYVLARRPENNAWIAVLAIGEGSGNAPNDRPAIQVTVVEPRAPERRMAVVEAPEMAREIAASGRVALRAVLFDFDRAEPRPDSRPQLEQIARFLRDAPADRRFVVAGHTDWDGGFAYNLDLSRRRAEAVVQALAREHGVDRTRLTPFGAGLAAPVSTNRTDEGRALNRRVEVVEEAGGAAPRPAAKR